jgi:hypothetical protein
MTGGLRHETAHLEDEVVHVPVAARVVVVDRAERAVVVDVVDVSHERVRSTVRRGIAVLPKNQ